MKDSPFPWDISLFTAGMTSVLPVAVTVKSQADCDKIFLQPPVRPRTYEKKSLPCWSPALYGKGERRSNKNVKAVTALVYDFDHATEDPRKVADKMKESNVQFILHTTWSHRPSEPRYRVILFLSRPLFCDEYAEAWENGLRSIGYDAGVDRQARNISRHYALPAQVDGEEYVYEANMDATPLDSSTLKTETEAEEKGSESGDLTLDTLVDLDDSGHQTIRNLIALGPGKHKCACPFQPDASAGSAFVRVTKDGRCFLQCTSQRHDHEKSQWWVATRSTKKGSSQRSVADRANKVKEVSDSLREYVEKRLAYNALQGVFYRHAEGAWQVTQPMRKEALQDHLMGLLSGKCDRTHAIALIDHILSRQVYGFDCQASKERIVFKNEVAMMNLYAWPDLIPEAHPWERIQDILYLLCDGDTEAIRWLIHWSAAVVQNPQRRSMVAVLVLSTQQGIGKSLYGRLLGEIIGKPNSVVVSNRALRDNFNSHYVTSLLVLADEVGIDKNADDIIAEMKAAITDDRIHCSTPYASRTTITNRMTWWLTSNKRRPFLVEQDDRRFTILQPSKATAQYRKMLQDCFDPKTSKFDPNFYQEVRGFAYHLKNLAIDWNLISKPHVSAVKEELQKASQSSADAFIDTLKKYGVVDVLTGYPAPPNYPRVTLTAAASAVPCETLYGSYREWCSRLGKKFANSEPMFRLAIKSLDGVKTKSARLGGKTLEVYLGLPVREVPAATAGTVVEFPK